MFALALPFYGISPDLQCEDANGTWKKCDKTQACRAGTVYKIDWESKYTIVNIITELELVCAENYEIGMIGMAAFLGYSISAVFLLPIPDIIGRKPSLIAMSLVSIVTYFLFMFAQSLIQIYLLA
mmetsp:Transcript_14363/g.14346  ORF Transcript_14363/g.14346 Transcript_14363/m.14346 type:complete len:125 (+) Transcript_14363:63-437(+)